MSDLDRFIEELASDTPTPGGGSVSALASVLACSLTQMVSGISLMKDIDEDVAAELRGALQRSETLRTTLSRLVEEDSRAYGAVMEALSLPKGSPQEKGARSASIQKALVGAAEVPIRTMKASLQALETAKLLAEKGSKNACSDVGVAALLAHAGLHGAHLNVRINLASVKNEKTRESMTVESRALLDKGKELLGETLAIVDSRLQ